MLEMLAGQGISTGGKLLESGVNTLLQDKEDSRHQEREFTYNEKASKNQQVRNLQNLQNAPSAYVQGLKRAGINPALAVSGQIPVGQSSALPVSGSGHMVPGTDSLAPAAAALRHKNRVSLRNRKSNLTSPPPPRTTRKLVCRLPRLPRNRPRRSTSSV